MRCGDEIPPGMSSFCDHPRSAITISYHPGSDGEDRVVSSKAGLGMVLHRAFWSLMNGIGFHIPLAWLWDPRDRAGIDMYHSMNNGYRLIGSYLNDALNSMSSVSNS